MKLINFTMGFFMKCIKKKYCVKKRNKWKDRRGGEKYDLINNK